MNTFLLDTYQLNVRGENERNLHIFYELLEASDSAHKDLLFLDNVCAFDFQMLCGTNDQPELLGDDDECELLDDAESCSWLLCNSHVPSACIKFVFLYTIHLCMQN